jgi:hypothetical protein
MEKYNNYLTRSKIVSVNYDKMDVNCCIIDRRENMCDTAMQPDAEI